MSEPRQVWLDRTPYEPPPVVCMRCREYIANEFAVMIKWVGGHPWTPLCRSCYDKPPIPDADPIVPWWERGDR